MTKTITTCTSHILVNCNDFPIILCRTTNVTVLCIQVKSEKEKRMCSLIFHMFSNKVHDNWSCEVSWVFLKKAEVALFGKILKCLAGLRCCAVDVWWECVNKCIVNPLPPFSFFSEMKCTLLILLKIPNLFCWLIVNKILLCCSNIFQYPLGELFLCFPATDLKNSTLVSHSSPNILAFRTYSSSGLLVTLWH